MKAPTRPSFQSSSEQGFSLIEVAIAIAIIGLLLVPFIAQYNMEEAQNRLNQTRSQIEVTKAALQKFAVKYGRYPRPADPSIASAAAGNGQEAAIPTTPCTPAIMSPCFDVGTRDTLIDGDPVIVDPSDPDPIYIGAVPFATIGITEDQSLDGYNNRLTYAVSAYLTTNTTFAEDAGVLRLQGNDNVATSDGADSRAHFIIISHGADARGAFSMSGMRVSPCGDPNVARDNENCDNDGIFDDGTVATATGRIGGRSIGTGTGYWDDAFAYTSTTSVDFWLPIADEPNMSNRNEGSILIGTTDLPDPSIRVNVSGTTRAAGVYTPELCEDNLVTCISTNVIGRDTNPQPQSTDTSGSGINCDPNMAMTGLSNGQEVCDSLAITDPGGIVFSACTGGTLPRGLNQDGTIYCEAP